MLVLGAGISTVADVVASEEFNGNTLTINNGNSVQPITISMYYYNYSTWEFVGSYHIPAGSSISIDLGNASYYNYGYENSYGSVTAFYGSNVTIY